MNKTYAFTDLHGQYDLWEQIRDYCDETDKLYFLGDACDRGPDGIKIIKELLEDPRVIYLKGNHEDFLTTIGVEMLNGDMSDAWLWEANGGWDTWEELQKESLENATNLLSKVEKLPTTALYKNKNGQTIYLSHSGAYNPQLVKRHGGEVLNEQVFIWDREHLRRYKWYREYPDAYVVHGHSPVQNFFGTDKPTAYCNKHKIDLDVASFYSGNIFLFDLDELKVEKIMSKKKAESKNGN